MIVVTSAGDITILSVQRITIFILLESCDSYMGVVTEALSRDSSSSPIPRPIQPTSAIVHSSTSHTHTAGLHGQRRYDIREAQEVNFIITVFP